MLGRVVHAIGRHQRKHDVDTGGGRQPAMDTVENDAHQQPVAGLSKVASPGEYEIQRSTHVIIRCFEQDGLVWLIHTQTLAGICFGRFDDFRDQRGQTLLRNDRAFFRFAFPGGFVIHLVGAGEGLLPTTQPLHNGGIAVVEEKPLFCIQRGNGLQVFGA